MDGAGRRACGACAARKPDCVIDWPDAIRVDGGLVGGGRLAWPKGADENEPPDWLVFGAMIRTVSMAEGSRACVRWPPRSRRKVSTSLARIALVEASRAI